MISALRVKQWAKEAAPFLYRSYIERHKAHLPAKIEALLSDPRPPVTLSETELLRLQSQYTPWWTQYDFDTYGNGRRAYERALSFIKYPPLREVGKSILDMGCGDGMLGPVLSAYGHSVTLLDYEDWRDSRAQGQHFVHADLGAKIPLPDSSFDFICSFNAFEHIPDPQLAMIEMVRLVKPGGHIWLDFNPLYSSPLGLHAFSLNMPYPQFLFDAALIQRKIAEFGLQDLGRKMTTLQPLNQWKLADFRQLWNRADCRVVTYKEALDESHLDIVSRFPQAFRGRGLTVGDLTVSGVCVLMEKINDTASQEYSE